LIVTDYFDLSGMVALVTGGSRGLGVEMVKGLADQGADVIVVSRDPESCSAAVAEVEARGRRGWAIPAHVGRWDAIGELVEEAYAAAGRIDILINNAGLAPAVAKSSDMSEELFDKTVGVNLKGPFRLSALIGPRMVAQGSGSIINVTSTGALKPEPEFAIYAAAKAALNSLTKGHALEFGPAVRVNAIMVGPFWTDMSKAWREEVNKTINSAVRRIGRPEEVVTAALYLASIRSGYTTGTVLTVDGGQR
jgi:NAD(P)-dependent dehydrogenase (short-subunit alcohol dehydrogenase family)